MYNTVSALFVDYDNIHRSLKDFDPRLAGIFERRPLDWMSILSRSEVDGEEILRNFVIRRCYANPDHMGRNRINYTQSAFEVVDCPALTNMGKNSADIYMVMDIMDTLQQFLHVEEFVIMSADADFAPVITRLRKHLKRTVIYENQVTARSYKNSCDLLINENDFVELLLELLPEKRPTKGTSIQKSAQASSKPQSRVQMSPVKQTLNADAQKIQKALYEYILQQRYPVNFSNTASEMRRTLGEDVCERWAGYSTFAKLVRVLDLPGVGMDMDSGGMFFVEEKMNDPSYRFGQTISVDEFTEECGIEPALINFATQAGLVIGIPKLLPQTYRAIFDTMSLVSKDQMLTNLEIAKLVVLELEIKGKKVDKSSVSFITRGLSMDGHRFGNLDTPELLASLFRERTEKLCITAGMQIDDLERSVLKNWIQPSFT